MSIHIEHNLFALKRRLEIQKSKPVQWLEIEAATGIHRNTLVNLSQNKTRRIDMDIAAKLLEYFNGEGLPVTLADLFVVTTDNAHGD